MLIASALLAALAVVLAWPVPLILGRARWPRRAPATALILWQAIALAGGLSMIGALLTFGLIPYGDTLLRSAGRFIDGLRRHPAQPGVEIWYLLALCAAVLLSGHLVSNLVLTIVSTERQRRRHRQLIELLAAPDPLRPNTRVIENAAPVAYCLPGALRSVTVLSQGLMSMLTPVELRAVVAHEEAHVTQRHDLLLVAFAAWHISLPWFPIAYRAEREVGALVEMLADDRARHTVDDRALAAAIILVAGGRLDGAGPGPQDDAVAEAEAEALTGTISETGGPVGWGGRTATARQTRARVGRLLAADRPLPLGARIAVAAGSIVLVAGPAVLLFAR